MLFPSFLYVEGTDNNYERARLVLKQDLKDLEFDGLLLNYNTPLDLSFTTEKGNRSFGSFLDANPWNQYYYSKLNEYSPALDLVYPGTNIKHLYLHNLYGYQHMKIVRSFF